MWIKEIIWWDNLKKYEKQAKEWFSRLVRLKGCLETTGSPEYGVCFTCGDIKPFSDLQCGHFISGRGNSLFFEENNSFSQCILCNTYKGGNLKIYREKMIKKFGIKEVERLESLRHIPQRISSENFRILAGEFRGEFKSLTEL